MVLPWRPAKVRNDYCVWRVLSLGWMRNFSLRSLTRCLDEASKSQYQAAITTKQPPHVGVTRSVPGAVASLYKNVLERAQTAASELMKAGVDKAAQLRPPISNEVKAKRI